MTNAISTYQGMIFLTILTIIYALVVRWIKPLRVHKKRKLSTISLKSSYLIYLAIYFIYIYMFLFSNSSRLVNEHITEARGRYYTTLFIVLTLVPNLAILIRRQIHKHRGTFNIMFTVINSLFIIWILFLFFNKKWCILI